MEKVLHLKNKHGRVRTMVVSYKNKVLRTGYDVANSESKDRYTAWANDFEREIESQCDRVGIDPDNLGINIDEINSGENLKYPAKEVAHRLVRKHLKKLRMI